MITYPPSALRRFRTLSDDLRRYRDELYRAGDERRVVSASALVDEAARLLTEVANGQPIQREFVSPAHG